MAGHTWPGGVWTASGGRPGGHGRPAWAAGSGQFRPVRRGDPPGRDVRRCPRRGGGSGRLARRGCATVTPPGGRPADGEARGRPARAVRRAGVCAGAWPGGGRVGRSGGNVERVSPGGCSGRQVRHPRPWTRPGGAGPSRPATLAMWQCIRCYVGDVTLATLAGPRLQGAGGAGEGRAAYAGMCDGASPGSRSSLLVLARSVSTGGGSWKLPASAPPASITSRRAASLPVPAMSRRSAVSAG